MKIKTSELIGAALDWAVAKCEGLDVYIPAFASRPWLQIRNPIGMPIYCPKWSTDWAQGGPIIEREKITISQGRNLIASIWCSDERNPLTDWYRFKQRGPTPLVAAMRCYVASKLGDETKIPEELL